jgi:aminopeptidase N
VASRLLSKLKIPNDLIKIFEEEPRLRIFKETPKISTYLFAIIAGPYSYIKKEVEGFPTMRIFVRKSLKKYMATQAEELFRITRIGMRFYEEFFKFRYPFGKYDQIFCPEYNIGAMENIGAVTYCESRFLFKEKPSTTSLNNFTIVALHELSHMW